MRQGDCPAAVYWRLPGEWNYARDFSRIVLASEFVSSGHKSSRLLNLTQWSAPGHVSTTARCANTGDVLGDSPMSSDGVAIKIENLSKCFLIYDQPIDRLKQFILNRLIRPRLIWKSGRQGKSYYREFYALRDVSFEVKTGETVGIIGRNGSGKSTLLQLICGTLTPSTGMVWTNGRVAALLELGSGFNPEFTGRENIYMNGAILGLSRKEMDARLDKIMAFADIGDFIERPVKTYSSGMLVRLAFAVIAHVDADILIIDEALAVGDALFNLKCMRFLREFSRTGTILFVSHDTVSVKNLCSRAIWLERGQARREGNPKEVCEAYLEAFYEAQQGKGVPTLPSPAKNRSELRQYKDQRAQFINGSNLRNDLEVFRFDPETASFGRGGAQILSVELLDPDGSPLAWVVGGEAVILRILARADQTLDSPIIGFYVKDRLGQTLFGDNTYLNYRDSPVSCNPGSVVEARFCFQMPIFPPGAYSISAAISDGTQKDHVMHQWIHDALVFKAEASSLPIGLVGVPMDRIELSRIAVDEAVESGCPGGEERIESRFLSNPGC